MYLILWATVLAWSVSASVCQATDLPSAKVHGTVGEASHLYLYPEGIYLHPFYNDVTGDTDKYLTASFKLGVLKDFEDFSIDSVFFWRLLTPSYKTKTRSQSLEKPLGRFADWAQIKTAVAFKAAPDDVFHHQVQMGLSHVGNKGGRQIHFKIHEITKNSVENLDYTNQPTGYFPTLDYAASIVGGVVPINYMSFQDKWSLGTSYDKFMGELYLDYNFKFDIKRNWWTLAGEFRVIRQFDSEVYEAVKPYRYEASIGTAIYGVFTPTLKYVSSFLRGDGVGQSYFDFVHFNFRF